MATVLRDYQLEMREQITDALRRKKKRIVVKSATGTGKTVMFSELCASAERKENPSLILLPRRELVYQTQKTLDGYGLQAGVIMAGEPMHYHRRCQIASVDTLHARAVKRELVQLPAAKLVVPDEAHLWIAPTRLAILQHYADQGSVVIGFTATPGRPDGLPLGNIFDELIEGWPTQKMIDHGYLIRPRYVCPTLVDLSKLKRKSAQGDFIEAALEEAFDKPKLVGEIIENWMLHASHRRTVVFCITRKHARHVLERFHAAGVRAEYVDGETKHDERAAIFARVYTGETQVLVNVFVATFGLDIPPIDCVVLARPTRSIVLYHQMVGRMLRPFVDGALADTPAARLAQIAASTKPDALVIDHAGAVDLHGFVEDPVPWTLAGKRSISELKREREEQEKAPKEMTCPSCNTIFKGARHCPNCGFEFVPPSEPVPFYRATLQEVDTGKRANKLPLEEKREFYAQALGYAQEKRYVLGWAKHKFKEKFGIFPDHRFDDVLPTQPGQLIIGWIKHMAMRRRFADNRK